MIPKPDDHQIELIFNYDKSSVAIFTVPNDSDYTDHVEELFVYNKSQYFSKYTLESDDRNNKVYSFPFPTYGKLSSFWNDELIQCDEVFSKQLKLKWIYQLTKGLNELHSANKYYGLLSAQCITINDNFNVQYTFVNKPSEFASTSYDYSSTFYLPTEFFAEQTHPKGIDQQKYDVYALGIILNSIVQEKFPYKPPDMSKEELYKMLGNQDGKYPEKKANDDFWKSFTEKVINSCLLPADKRPGIKQIFQSLQQFLHDKNIQILDSKEMAVDEEEKTIITYNYKLKTMPIVDSLLSNKSKISPLVTSQINITDILNAIIYIQEKYRFSRKFFPIEKYFASPFNIGIKNYDLCCSFFNSMIYKENEDDIITLKSFVLPHTEDKNPDFLDKITEDEIKNLNEYIKKHEINNFPFCNLHQLIRLIRYDSTGLFIDPMILQIWIVYLSKCLADLEKQTSKPLLPKNFSSNTVLVSLVPDFENKAQFQLSIFPCPVQEESKMYTSNEEGIDTDIYAFGVLMFEILSLFPSDNNEVNPENFESAQMRKLFNDFHEEDNNFQYNINLINNEITDFIAKCLTPRSQPESFAQIYEELYNNQINAIIDNKLMKDQCNYFIANPEMDLVKFFLVYNDLNNNPIKKFVYHFLTKDLNEEQENNNNYQNNQEGSFNPFDIFLFQFLNMLKRCYSPMKKSTDDENEIELDDLIQILVYLRTIENEIKSMFSTEPIDEQIKSRIDEENEIFKSKCRDLPATKLNYNYLPTCEVIRNIELITERMCKTIPHLFEITLNNNYEEDEDENEKDEDVDENEKDEDVDENEKDEDEDVDDTKDDDDIYCKLSDLIDYAKKNNIQTEVEGKNRILMYFDPEKSIFDLNLLNLK